MGKPVRVTGSGSVRHGFHVIAGPRDRGSGAGEASTRVAGIHIPMTYTPPSGGDGQAALRWSGIVSLASGHAPQSARRTIVCTPELTDGPRSPGIQDKAPHTTCRRRWPSETATDPRGDRAGSIFGT